MRPTSASQSTAAAPSPVLVTGPAERPASLVAWALGQHPRLQVADGTHWLSTYAGAMAEVRLHATELQRTKSALSRVGQLHGKVDDADFWRAAACLADHYVRAADGSHGTRWVTAPPQAWREIERLAELFPAAQIVHVSAAPGLAVAASSTKSRVNPRPMDADEACRRWISATRACLAVEQRRGAGRVFRLDFGDLLEHPDKVLAGCLEFLGLPHADSCQALLEGVDASSLTPVDVDALAQGAEARRLFAELGEHPVPDRPNLGWPSAPPETARQPVDPDRRRPRSDLCRFVDGALPRGGVVAVVSRGDPDLVRTQVVTARHFPSSADGTYVGYHPADSAAAIAMLDRAMGEGVGHLAIPRQSFWWMDFYAGLRRHLLGAHELVACHGQIGALFSLTGRPAQHRRLFSLAYLPEEAESAVEPAERSGVARVSQTGEEAGQALSGAVDQFVLLGPEETGAAPAGWTVRERDGWRLAAHPHLPVLDLVNPCTGARTGWVLGWPVDESGLVHGRLALDGNHEDGIGFEDALDRLSGRFLCVVLGGRPRVYLDGAGSLAAVYHRSRRLVASTTTVLHTLLEGPRFPRPSPLEFPADRANQFFPAGLTHDEAINRLLPNHLLDLGEWAARRHWPRGPLERVDERELVPCLSEIATDVRRTMAAFVRDGELLLGVTAGRDSRVLLACAKDILDGVATFTFDYGPTRDAVVDVVAGRRLAAAVGVRHTVVPVPETLSDADAAEYRWLIGHGAHPGKGRDFRMAARAHLPLSRTLVPGFFGGGIGRGFYWPRMPRDRQQLTARKLLERLRLPTGAARLVEATDGWLQNVPAGDARFVLDLLYHENRGGCWASQHLYGFAPFRSIVLPFGSRRVMQAMLRLPVVYRSKKKMPADLVRITAPELLDMPFQDLPE